MRPANPHPRAQKRIPKQSGRAVGMRRHQMQVEPADPPQQQCPDDVAKRPPIDHEMKERRADGGVPPSGRAQSPRGRVPAGDHARSPFALKQKDREQRERQQGQLEDRRVPQPSRLVQDVFELGQLLLLHDSVADELAHGATNGGVDHNLGQEQERQADEQPTIHAEVVEERNHDPVADGQSVFERQDEQRKPRDRDGSDGPAQYVRQARPNQPDPVQEVIDRTAHDDR